MWRSAEQSDANLSILRAEFGDCVLPVFHQDDGRERLFALMDQVKDRGNYMCLSPNNRYADKDRVDWAISPGAPSSPLTRLHACDGG